MVKFVLAAMNNPVVTSSAYFIYNVVHPATNKTGPDFLTNLS